MATLNDLRIETYAIINEEVNTVNYPQIFVDNKINFATELILTGNFRHYKFSKHLKKPVLGFLVKKAFYTLQKPRIAQSFATGDTFMPIEDTTGMID